VAPAEASKAAGADAHGDLRGVDQLGGKVDAVATARHKARLELFERRCSDLARQVSERGVPFVHAVDVAYDAAVWSGLADDVGDDQVQLAMARAFMGARP
jgi:flagellar biosynthesis regulator FlaF